MICSIYLEEKKKEKKENLTYCYSRFNSLYDSKLVNNDWRKQYYSSWIQKFLR